ncbi:MAG: cupin 2 protein [Myxococcaceae bacterium]|nr:cupin 2 protein [Myxococcaceae bacterium]
MSQDQRVVAIRPHERSDPKRGLRYFEGISAASANTRALAMQRLVIPPGARAEPHSHDGYETAIYILHGRVQTFYGPGLESSLISEAGDFLFLPPEVPHMPVNLSQDDDAIAIIARSFAGEVEPVTPYVVDPAAAHER